MEYMSHIEMLAMQKKKMVLKLLREQLPLEIHAVYKKVAEEHGKPIGEAAERFKTTTEGHKKVAHVSFSGKAGEALEKDLDFLAGRPAEFFGAGVHSIRSGGAGPVFGIPWRG